MQSCSGGRIGNFLESSFKDLDTISRDDYSQKKLDNKKVVLGENKESDNKKFEKRKQEVKLKSLQENRKVVLKENKEIDNKNYEKRKKEVKIKSLQENKKVVLKENKEINNKNYEKRKKEVKIKSLKVNKKDKNLGKIQKPNNNKTKKPSKKTKIELQSYKIIFILKNVDPKDPTEELSSVLINSEVNFEIEKIERILESKNKNMNKN